MEFKIVSIDSQHDSESDYDTAVDLVTYTFEQDKLVLETLSGVQIHIERIIESKSSSYISPCEEEDPSFSEDKGQNKNINIWAEMLTAVPELEENHQAFLSQLKKDVAFLKTTENKQFDFDDPCLLTVHYYPELKSSQLFNHMTSVEQNQIYNYLNYLSGEDSTRVSVAITEKQAEKMLNMVFNRSRLKEGWTLRLVLEEEMEKQIKNLDTMNYRIINHNMKTRIHNNCSLSSYLLSEKIEQLFEQAQLEMYKIFHPEHSQRLKI